ncbi:MAG: hypothetical protein HOB26_07505 [Flavobacteriales bacterium]|jgi:hypothetical protein|nr:hypothetical protein [Flavobacteriales bacterium]
MAVDDVVSQINATGGASPYEFRPAAGVSIAVTSFGGYPHFCGLVSTALPVAGNTYKMFLNHAATNMSSSKILITNDIWLVMENPAGVITGFTGIQIK